LTILSAALFVSSAVQAGHRVDCLHSDGSNQESVCRHECAQDGAVAFSTWKDDTWCLCYPKLPEGLGTYTGSGDGKSGLNWLGMACYSMAGEETKFLDHGDCVVDDGYGTKHVMNKCEDSKEENQGDCLNKGRFNIEYVCQKECMKHDSVAFSVSYEYDDDICHCYPRIKNDEYTGSAKLYRDKSTCYAMNGSRIEVLGNGECVKTKIVEFLHNGVTDRRMKICPQDEKLLRGSVSA